MISTKKLIKMARKWQRLAVAGRKRVSLPRSNSIKKTQAVEKGHFVFYTADERRFALPLVYLESQVFRELLRMAEEEFGLTSYGPITLPFDSIFMEYAISLIQKSVTRDLQEALLLSLSPASISYEKIVPISCY